MRLAGEANWWVPRPLRKLYERIGIPESAPPEPDVTAGGPDPDREPVAVR